jgi:FKBP-type peptidyl-prolyl cis-trans isomerase FkpA
MKKFLSSVLVLSLLLLNSCGKNDTGCQPVPVASEKGALVAYCTANGINYTEHSSGLLYEIVTPGTGAAPTITSTISVVYTGKHFDNTVFDASANPYTNVLNNLIDGWKIGIPLIKKGGRIKLIIPSAMAYSCTGSQSNGVYSIQPNEPLFFDVTLSDVK